MTKYKSMIAAQESAYVTTMTEDDGFQISKVIAYALDENDEPVTLVRNEWGIVNEVDTDSSTVHDTKEEMIDYVSCISRTEIAMMLEDYCIKLDREERTDIVTKLNSLSDYFMTAKSVANINDNLNNLFHYKRTLAYKLNLDEDHFNNMLNVRI